MYPLLALENDVITVPDTSLAVTGIHIGSSTAVPITSFTVRAFVMSTSREISNIRTFSNSDQYPDPNDHKECFYSHLLPMRLDQYANLV